jgi:hypothetical protein
MASIGIYNSLNWAPSTTTAVALPQAVLQNGTIVLNGTFSDGANPMSLEAHGSRRNITITSTANIAASTSVVRGYVNGTIVTENIVNPNVATVSGAVIFDSIIDITVTGGAAANISVGIGLIGFFNPMLVDIASSTISASTIQLILYTGTISYSIYETADKNAVNCGVSFDALITNGTYILSKDSAGADIANKAASGIYHNIPLVLNSSYLIKINASIAASTFKLIYMKI